MSADERAKAWADILTANVAPLAFAESVCERLRIDSGCLTPSELSALRQLTMRRLSEIGAMATERTSLASEFETHLTKQRSDHE